MKVSEASWIYFLVRD